jgi:hypothetical protein
MKTNIVIIMMLISLSAASQNFRFSEKQEFNVSFAVEPYSSFKEESLNFTAEIEYESGSFYIKAGSQVLTGLQGGYIDLAGGVGLSFTSGYFERMRYTAGIRAGFIKRGYTNNDPQTYPLFGQEVSTVYNFDSGFFVGLRLTNDLRTDFLYSGAEPEYQLNGSIKFGKRF